MPSPKGYEPLIAVLPGDGVGVEVVEQGLHVLAATAKRFGWTYRTKEALVGGAAIDAENSALPASSMALCKESDAVYFGAVGGPKWDSPRATVRPEQGILALRKALKLYANLRPIKLYPSLLESLRAQGRDRPWHGHDRHPRADRRSVLRQAEQALDNARWRDEGGRYACLF